MSPASLVPPDGWLTTTSVRRGCAFGGFPPKCWPTWSSPPGDRSGRPALRTIRPSGPSRTSMAANASIAACSGGASWRPGPDPASLAPYVASKRRRAASRSASGAVGAPSGDPPNSVRSCWRARVTASSRLARAASARSCNSCSSCLRRRCVSSCHACCCCRAAASASRMSAPAFDRCSAWNFASAASASRHDISSKAAAAESLPSRRRRMVFACQASSSAADSAR